jgi:hypothetical protein
MRVSADLPSEKAAQKALFQVTLATLDLNRIDTK